MTVIMVQDSQEFMVHIQYWDSNRIWYQVPIMVYLVLKVYSYGIIYSVHFSGLYMVYSVAILLTKTMAGRS